MWDMLSSTSVLAGVVFLDPPGDRLEDHASQVPPPHHTAGVLLHVGAVGPVQVGRVAVVVPVPAGVHLRAVGRRHVVVHVVCREIPKEKIIKIVMRWQMNAIYVSLDVCHDRYVCAI